MARNSVGRVLPRHGRSQRFKSARANHKNQALTENTVSAFLVFVPILLPVCFFVPKIPNCSHLIFADFIDHMLDCCKVPGFGAVERECSQICSDLDKKLGFLYLSPKIAFSVTLDILCLSPPLINQMINDKVSL